MNSTMRVSFMVALIVAAMNTLSTTTAYTPVNPKNSHSRSAFTNSHHHPSPTTSTTTSPSSPNSDMKTRGNNWRLSNSVLASCDTLPSFPTAHGILSPETVSRMDVATRGGQENMAVAAFLRTYRSKGPMACIDMLSDPNILPHLTQAMREIAL